LVRERASRAVLPLNSVKLIAKKCYMDRRSGSSRPFHPHRGQTLRDDARVCTEDFACIDYMNRLTSAATSRSVR